MGVDPVTMMLVAGGVQAAGNVLGGFAEADTANAQSQQARNNAIIARQNAQYAMASGEQNAANQGLETRKIVGALKAGQGASGIDVNTGSAVDVRSSAAQIGQLDALTIRSNAARQAYGFDVEAANQTMQSKLYRKQAKAAPWMGALKAGGSLLSAGANASAMSSQQALLTGGSSGGGGYSGGVASDFGDPSAVWATVG